MDVELVAQLNSILIATYSTMIMIAIFAVISNRLSSGPNN